MLVYVEISQKRLLGDVLSISDDLHVAGFWHVVRGKTEEAGLHSQSWERLPRRWLSTLKPAKRQTQTLPPEVAIQLGIHGRM